MSIALNHINSAQPIPALRHLPSMVPQGPGITDGSVRELPSRGPETVTRGALADWQIKRVRQYVEAHLEQRISCDTLAAIARLSKSHFGRAFRASTGETPHAYVMGRRVARAQALMRETTMPLSLIALECGMADQSHLSRVFLAFVGVSPRSWRRRA